MTFCMSSSHGGESRSHLVPIVVEGSQAVMGRPRHSDVMPGAVCSSDACRVVADAPLVLHDRDAPVNQPSIFLQCTEGGSLDMLVGRDSPPQHV